jgi:hypothetical protein
MDRVHSAVNWRASSGPWWTKGGADKRHGGVSPVRGVRARTSGASGRLTGARAAEERRRDSGERLTLRGL